MINIDVLSRTGTPLADLTKCARNVNYAHSLNGGRPLTFDLPLNDAHAAEQYMRKRNLVVVYSDEVEPWSGYIVRSSFAGPNVSYLVHPIIARLDERKTRPTKMENLPAGVIFNNLMTQANGRAPTGLIIGTVFGGGKPYTLEMGTEGIYQKLGDLIDLTKYEYVVEMVYPGLWEVSLYERYGQDLTASVCIEYGMDTDDDPSYDEDMTEFANAIIAAGKPPENTNSNSDPTAEWNQRPRAEFIDWASVGDDGYAEDVLELPEITDSAMLREKAHEEVERRKNPKLLLGLTLNRKRKLWSKFRDGDIVAVHMPTYGYTGLVVPYRILGREIDDDSATMAVAGEVVVGKEAEALSLFKQALYPTGNGFPRYPGIPTPED